MHWIMTVDDYSDLVRIADDWGISGIVLALARWSEKEGGLDFVRRCVQSVKPEDCDAGFKD